MDSDDDEKVDLHGHERVMLNQNKDEPDDGEYEDFENMITPEERAEEILRAQVKLREAEKIKEYEERLQTTTLANFEDRPDPIEEIRVVKSADNYIVIEWDKPCENNSPIQSYNIYLSCSANFEDATMIDVIDPDC